MLPAPGPRPAYRLAIPGAALLLYGAAAALWQWGPHAVYFRILRLFAFEPFRFPFLDIHAVLAAVQCRRLGFDVYSTNPCDALGRPHVYSPLWLRLTPDCLGISATTAVGLGLGMLFIASLFAICRPRTRSEALLMALTALSPVAVYALERANNDLIVYLLMLAGCALLRTSRPTRFGAYALFLFAGLLKYYPLIVLATIARERWRDAILGAAAVLSVLLLLVAGDHVELGKALANMPSPSYFSDAFAAVNLPFGLAAALAVPFRRTLAFALLAILAALTIARTRRSVHLLERAAPDWGSFEADCLIAGALVLAGCFFAGQNIGYRGIYFVLAMPGLLVLRRSAQEIEGRRFLVRMIAAVLFIVWEPVCREAVHVAAFALAGEALRPRAVMLFWLGRELVWWWLISGLAAIALCGLWRLPLFVDTATALARLGSPRRRRQPG